MQTIVTLETEVQVAELGAQLRRAGIRYATELHRTDRGDRFDVRLLNLDDLKKAQRIVRDFEPGRLSTDAVISKDDPIIPKARLGQARRNRIRRPRPVCIILTLLCSLFFFVHEVEQREIEVDESRVHVDGYVMTPIMAWMLIDLPSAFNYLIEFQNTLPQKPTPGFNDLNEAQQSLLQKMESTPYWAGIYPILVAKATGQPSAIYEGELFERFREGQVWRLITPGLLHESLPHLFFNMFWLLAIGSLIEQRIGSGRFIALTTILLVVTSVAQYLVSGPLFRGFSGAACGFVGFVFSRRQTAPWENYRIEPAIFWLFFGYVGIFAFIQLVLFILALFKTPAWPMTIANTAHIVGALAGYGLGRLSFFSWRSRT